MPEQQTRVNRRRRAVTSLDPRPRRRRTSVELRTPAPDDLGQKVGPYVLREELGRGGMGVVYRAYHSELDREVAIKLLLVPVNLASPEHRRRFRAEARAAGKLCHRHLVTVHDAGTTATGLPYLVLDLIEGVSLEQRLLLDGPLRQREAASLTSVLAQTVAYAHGRKVLHRDLKPANVLLDAAGEPHLTDFGLAKDLARLTAGPATASGSVLGTPSYMPPEQARGEAVDARADVYSLGATLYEMLTGRPPFQGPNLVATLQAVLHEPLVRPSKIRPKLDPALEAICLRCLERDPADRYPSARALASDLTRFLGGSGSGSRPSPLFERGSWGARLAAQWHLAAAGAAVVAGLLFVGVGGGGDDAPPPLAVAPAQPRAAAAAEPAEPPVAPAARPSPASPSASTTAAPPSAPSSAPFADLLGDQHETPKPRPFAEVADASPVSPVPVANEPAATGDGWDEDWGDDGWSDDGWDDGWDDQAAPTAADSPEAERDYVAAVDIVQARDVSRYGEAIELLERVARSPGPLALDAQAYIDWVRADVLVRDATAAYCDGRFREAFAGLEQALEFEVLGPDARRGVRERGQRWRQQMRDFGRVAQPLVDAWFRGEAGRALRELDRRVLQVVIDGGEGQLADLATRLSQARSERDLELLFDPVNRALESVKALGSR